MRDRYSPLPLCQPELAGNSNYPSSSYHIFYLVPRALFPGFPPKPGKSALGTRLASPAAPRGKGGGGGGYVPIKKTAVLLGKFREHA